MYVLYTAFANATFLILIRDNIYFFATKMSVAYIKSLTFLDYIHTYIYVCTDAFKPATFNSFTFRYNISFKFDLILTSHFNITKIH